MNATWYLQAYHAAIDALRAGFSQFMPAGAYRDYCLWALSPANPQQEVWLRSLGVPQMTKMTLDLLNGMIGEEDTALLINYSIPINNYLTYEVASDDLAIGLANRLDGDEQNIRLRKQVLSAFNTAMIERLRGSSKTTDALLQPIAHLAKQISSFDQSIVPDKHRMLAQQYIAMNPAVSMDDIEFSVLPRLVTNIEACVHLTRLSADLQVASIIRQGLISRYRAVQTLLEEGDISLSRRIFIGADAILVVPTLGYYVGIFAEVMHPMKNFRYIVEDGTLADALYNAALLVRLLNDLGTVLLKQTDDRTAFLQSLHAKCAVSGCRDQSFAHLLINSLNEFGPMVTRLYKDVALGEYNVCLHDITALPADRALPSFGQRLDYLALLYSQRYAYFTQLLKQMTDVLGDARVSGLIEHFVRFHETLYYHPYTHAAGEYTG